MNDVTVNIKNMPKSDYDDLMAIVKRSQQPADMGIRYRSEINGKYWHIDSSGLTQPHVEAGDDIDGHLYATGNYFKTKELAQAYLDYQLATQVIIDYIAKGNTEKGWVADFSGANHRNCIVIIASGELAFASNCDWRSSDARFYGHMDIVKQSIIDLEKEYLIYFNYDGRTQ